MIDIEERPDAQLPHLETFSRAAELGSFTGAARALGLTQAAVSQRIHALERALGVPLFQRRGGRVLPTEAGRRLYDYAQKIFGLHEEARREVAGHETPVGGELLLAASSIPGEHLLPALASRFGRKYPHIRVHASVSDSAAVIRQLERGEVSLGMVGRKTDAPHLEFRYLASDRMLLIVPPEHAWGRRKRVSVEQLCGPPLILREVGSGLRHCFETSLERAGHSPAELRVVLELGSNEAIKEAVLQGAGLAILSAYAVRKELRSGLLHALEVRGMRCDRDMYLVRDLRRVLPPPARLFLAFLESHPVPALTP
jgi:DNA-binding transcriptional LysR family regulator